MIYYCEFVHSGGKKGESLTARRLLKFALKREYGIDYLPEIFRGEFGKPYFVDFPAKFNLSHSENIACCALFPFEVGCDVERRRPVKPSVIERVCTVEEREYLKKYGEENFILLWSLKESRMKLSGKGLAFGAKSAAFAEDGAGGLKSAEEGIETRSFLLESGTVLTACAEKPLPDFYVPVPFEILPSL